MTQTTASHGTYQGGVTPRTALIVVLTTIVGSSVVFFGVAHTLLPPPPVLSTLQPSPSCWDTSISRGASPVEPESAPVPPTAAAEEEVEVEASVEEERPQPRRRPGVTSPRPARPRRPPQPTAPTFQIGEDPLDLIAGEMGELEL